MKDMFIIGAPPVLLVIAGAILAWRNRVMMGKARRRDREAERENSN